MTKKNSMRAVSAAAVTGLGLAVLAVGASTGATASPETQVVVSSPTYQKAVAQAAAAPGAAKVTVVATGGTLAGKANGRDTFGSYRAGTYLMSDLLDQLRPELNGVADVDAVQFGNGGSSSYTIEKYRELTMAVEEALKTSDGVVVTTGTDTMEEFAYWLDLTVQSKKPVVITGAMRPWAAGETPGDKPVIGTEGPANLYNAVKLAAGQRTYCFGTVLMLNDEIHAAREVRKTNTTRMDTFGSPSNGPLGYIDEGATVLNHAPARLGRCDGDGWATPFDVSTITPADLPKVEIAYAYQEASGSMIEGFVNDGAKGIVTMGTGAGGLSGTMGAARTAAIGNGVWFVSTTRTGTGNVTGSGNGVIAGGDLQGTKARLLLLLSRAFTDDIAKARGWFSTIGNPAAVYVPGEVTEPEPETPEPTVTGTSATKLKIAKPVKVRKKFRVTVTVTGAEKVIPTGTVTFRINGTTVKKVNLYASKKGVITIKLPKQKSPGKIGVEAYFTPAATSKLAPSNAISWVHVKRK
ncbi:asparaginase [Nocardioides sp. Bht2]|uniref:asparaginase n=1 Tax=Nocardioides sp. Bht2 TaxID=3392297 RepID=UPI0039B65C4C